MSDRSPQDPQDEDELVAQRRFLRQVIDLNPSFIFAKDREGRFTLVNQAVADNYGTTVEELVGRTDADFNPDAEQVEHFRRDDLEVMDTRREKVVPEEVITDSTGQKRWLHTIKRPIVGPDGRADQVLGVSTDITGLRLLEEQLAQAQKMEAVGRLAGGVAHDFNNLLTVILGSVDMLLDTLEPGHPGQPHGEEIRRAGERAAMLTRQLLAFSRRQLLQPGVLDLNRIVTDGARMLRHLIGEDIELVVLPEAADARVRADATQITQVILNLAINARDAMPHGGTLTIRTFLSAGDGASGATPGGCVTIAVTDTGHGIAPEVVPHIFEPFFTTKPVGLGTGLGLATVLRHRRAERRAHHVHHHGRRGHDLPRAPAARRGRRRPGPGRGRAGVRRRRDRPGGGGRGHGARGGRGQPAGQGLPRAGGLERQRGDEPGGGPRRAHPPAGDRRGHAADGGRGAGRASHAPAAGDARALRVRLHRRAARAARLAGAGGALPAQALRGGDAGPRGAQDPGRAAASAVSGRAPSGGRPGSGRSR